MQLVSGGHGSEGGHDRLCGKIRKLKLENNSMVEMQESHGETRVPWTRGRNPMGRETGSAYPEGDQ